MAGTLACQISHKSWARQDQLCHLALTFGPSLLKFKNQLYSKLSVQNSKMTRTKKTLGRNWTRYHNYYGMNHVLERACSKKLHWNQETIREYTVNHAPEVNYQKATQYVDNPPYCQMTMMTTGSGTIQNCQVLARPRASSCSRKL